MISLNMLKVRIELDSFCLLILRKLSIAFLILLLLKVSIFLGLDSLSSNGSMLSSMISFHVLITVVISLTASRLAGPAGKEIR